MSGAGWGDVGGSRGRSGAGGASSRPGKSAGHPAAPHSRASVSGYNSQPPVASAEPTMPLGAQAPSSSASQNPAATVYLPPSVPPARPGSTAATAPTSPPGAEPAAGTRPYGGQPGPPPSTAQAPLLVSQPEARARVPQDDAGPRRRWRVWVFWGLAILAVVVAVGVTYRIYGTRPLIIKTVVPAVAAQVGVVLLAVAAAVALVRRRLTAVAQRARRDAQEDVWGRHQQFLRRLDHELKNPLTAVRAAVADLPRAMPEERQARVEVVDAQARRMGRLVTDLRKLAELETTSLTMEDVDIAETVQDAAQAVGEEGLTRGGAVRIRVDLPRVPWPLPHVRGDGDLLYSAIYNVISNASKYTPPNGSIEVHGREESGTVTIEVADTGIGVPQADQPYVWSELARAGNARSVPGSGMGLALVDTIVRRHGGTVRMASREGVGTRVWMALPVEGPVGEA